MSEYVLRTDPVLDLYVLYSDSAYAVVGVGTRKEIKLVLTTPTQERGVPALGHPVDGPEARLVRADSCGTSALMGERLGGYSDERLPIFLHGGEAGLWWLRRENLTAYARALHDHQVKEAATLLETATSMDVQASGQAARDRFNRIMAGVDAMSAKQQVTAIAELDMANIAGDALRLGNTFLARGDIDRACEWLATAATYGDDHAAAVLGELKLLRAQLAEVEIEQIAAGVAFGVPVADDEDPQQVYEALHAAAKIMHQARAAAEKIVSAAHAEAKRVTGRQDDR